MGQLIDDLRTMIEAEKEHQARPPSAPNCRCEAPSDKVRDWPAIVGDFRQIHEGKPGEIFLIDVRPGDCFLDDTQLYVALEANSSCLVAQSKLGRMRIYTGHRPGEIRVILITQAQFLAAEAYIAKIL
jgi:hypothetical protein